MRELVEEIKTNILQLESTADTARVFHGRGKSLPGFENITVEYLSGTVLVILFGERPDGWFQAFSRQVKEALNPLAEIEVLFQSRYIKHAPVFNSLGVPVELEKVISENQLKYQLQLGGSQNFGFFTDMKCGRDWAARHSSRRRVLNLFSYTCSFSVAAMSGGADNVINVDMSSAALSVGRKNHQLNHQSLSNVMFQKLNILKSWGRIKKYGPYDLVIVDPPSFQKGSFSFSKDYRKIVGRLAEMTSPGADILFCLNDPLVTLEDFMSLLESETFEFVARVGNPVVMKEVEANLGLKVLHYKKVTG